MSTIGLTSAEAADRLRVHGPNELPAAGKTPMWRVFARQFLDFMVLLLIAASVGSLLLGDVVEAIAIFAIVVLNSAIGFVQEWRADAALGELRKLSAPGATVQRDGKRRTIRSAELVPGDLIMLEAGNYVPADGKLTESASLQINEAALTGESSAADKDAAVVTEADAPMAERVNMVFSGTLIARGRGSALVTATGPRTEIGMIAHMMAAIEEEPTPLQRRLARLGKTLSLAALATCALVMLVQLARTTDLSLIQEAGVLAYFTASSAAIHQSFLLAVSLAVAAVPEGLAAIVTINLALGMRAMARNHALVRRLHAVETLGSTTVICSDKTGTMTQNAMTVVRVFAGGQSHVISGPGEPTSGISSSLNPDGRQTGTDPAAPAHRALMEVLRAGLLCSDALMQPATTGSLAKLIGDPTEGALVAAAAQAGLLRSNVETDAPRIFEQPFDSERKTMITVHREGDHCFAVIKGAPEVLIPRCDRALGDDLEELPLNGTGQQALLAIVAALAGQALRVIAVARTSVIWPTSGEAPSNFAETKFVFLGLFGMIDPPRPEVAPAILLAQRAGVRTLMITGDNPRTALAIAQQVGILSAVDAGNDAVLDGRALDMLSDVDLRKRLGSVCVFARMSPKHKLRLVTALRTDGQIVAMTGDGVNDAPALKQADIGVAMGITGTDVSKEVADIVLTDDNFASIVQAVAQGRVIYANIRKFVAFLLKTNAAEILIILIASLMGWASPLNVIQLLWLNLVTDGAPALALGLEPAEPDTMLRPPRAPNEQILDRRMMATLVLQAAALTAVVLGVYAFGLTFLPAEANTLAFLTLTIAELALAYSSRSETASMFALGLFRNRALQFAAGSSLVLLLVSVYVPFVAALFHTVPVSAVHLAIVGAVALLPAMLNELVKWRLRTVTPRAG